MADTIEVGPPAVDQTDNLTIYWVPTIADITAPKVATEITAAAAKRLTYSFTPDGWAPQFDQAVLADARLTLKQDLQSFDKTVVGLTLKYVDSTAAGSAAMVLLEGLSGFFVERRNFPNATAAAAAQKGRVYPVTLGAQRPGVPDGQGKFTISQTCILTGVVGLPVAFVA